MPKRTTDHPHQLDLFVALMGEMPLRDDKEAMSVPLVSLAKGKSSAWRRASARGGEGAPWPSSAVPDPPRRRGDGYAEQWAHDIKRTRHIGDFSRWKDHDAYQKAFDRLLRDLRIETA
jgi:hypothetical protein